MASRKELVESELLLLQYRKGNSKALERLVRLWERPLYCYVRHLLNTQEEAKDLTQEIWLHVIQKVHTVRDSAAFPAWLFKVARNHAATHFRGMRLLEHLPENASAAEFSTGDENGLLATLNAEQLRWGLSRLSPPHRDCLMLHFLEDFSLKEVADITGVTLGTVKSRLHYAKKALREVLEQENTRDEQSQTQR